MPDWKSVVSHRLAALKLNAAAESDLAEEIAQHLEDRYRAMLSAGAAEQEAWRRTLAELNDIDALRTGLRPRQLAPRRDLSPGDPRPGGFLRDFVRDVHYACRTMRKSPFFVIFAVLTLAFGIGANTTVFTLINTLILNPLPVRNSAGLAVVAAAGAAKSGMAFPVSYADLEDYRNRNEVFTSLAAYTSPRNVTFQPGGAAESMFAELVTANYFSTLGLAPAIGRFFVPEENAAPGGHPVAVMNYATWQTRFGASPGILGRTVRINGVVLTIVGVAPRGFIGMNAIFGPDLWIPAGMAGPLFPNSMENAWTDRTKTAFQGVGRLRPGATHAAAQANLAPIAAALAREYPADQGRTILVQELRNALFASSGGGAAAVMFAGGALLAVVGIVLLIACSNVANLLLARSAARRREMAVRLAMGASRSRLVRQLLTESLLLGIMSGVAGFAIGYVGLIMLFGALPGAANFAQPKLDATVFLFAASISVATGFLFGVIPAFKAARGDVSNALREDARSVGRSRARVTLANALLVSQVAFSFLLLVTAALFLRSIQRAYQMDPGFQTAHLAVYPSNPGQAGYDRPRSTAFYRDVRQRVAAMPAVESVSWASNLPLWARSADGLQIEGRQVRSRADTVRTVVTSIDRSYFTTSGIGLEAGRDFTDLDGDDSTPVAIINGKLARDYFPNGALGRRIQLPGEKQMRQVVGVARTANYTSWGEPPQGCVYVPFEQKYSDAMVLYVRSKGDPREIFNDVEREIHSAGPQVLIFGMRVGSEIVNGGLFQAKMAVVLLTVFGLMALGLASVGLYGLLAYSVSQRRREIGLRMALGASQSSVLKLVLREGMTLVAAGILLGALASVAAGNLLSRMLFGVSAGDPLSVSTAAGVLSAVALFAAWLPARRATRIDPLSALHET